MQEEEEYESSEDLDHYEDDGFIVNEAEEESDQPAVLYRVKT